MHHGGKVRLPTPISDAVIRVSGEEAKMSKMLYQPLLPPHGPAMQHLVQLLWISCCSALPAVGSVLSVVQSQDQWRKMKY